MARLPTWAIAALLFLLFVVLPCISVHLDDADGFEASKRTAAAARDVERNGFIAAEGK